MRFRRSPPGTQHKDPLIPSLPGAAAWASNSRHETFRDDFTFPQQPGGDPALPVPLPRRRVHVLGQHRAACAGRRPARLSSTRSTWTSIMLPRCRTAALVLKEDPLRCQALPHMMLAQWDLLELLMDSHGGAAIPSISSCIGTATSWHWINRPLGIDQTFHLRRPLDPALRADGIYHPPGARRFLHPRPARRQPVDGCRHGHHAGRLVARFRYRHELHRMARPGAAGASRSASSSAP